MLVNAILNKMKTLNITTIGFFFQIPPQRQTLQQCERNICHALPHHPPVLRMAFAMGEVNLEKTTLGSWSTTTIPALDMPVLQAITHTGIQYVVTIPGFDR